ncbi:MAG: nitronate monooxygenase [Alphaproteobacteria bacterium]|nr:nitronate monooxygenase [Alphaproteobacteria bacterium]MBU0795835.1 nitronate monooxygenase [Alphaproteobacteria bacterium]MBU0885757.1 nitronate monooxygenase [Alphaproteobacteria bacterium]MBU1814460.1 nitronate monooxygenase [Alphaproteobacteria bacterium]MBU2089347.1 nitronate monooxygenase [Alphaproteobacteria bacterium]
MPIRTRLTERLHLRHPILLAPMALVSGGRLASAVSAAGGLGMIGGGYGDAEWLAREFAAAGNQRIGCGFITWSLAKQPHLLDIALDHKPAAVMLSFGDPAPFAARVRQAGIPLICQVQTLAHAREALAAGADIIVAQGGEAGGHGATRGTFALVPAVIDLVQGESPGTLVLAAGGVADGRGLAAALMLGADGVLVGTRFYASAESLAVPEVQQSIVDSAGDDTLRTSVFDIARKMDWPDPFTIRAVKNGFTAEWHGREAALMQTQPAEAERYQQAVASRDMSVAGVFAGEGADMIRDIAPAGALIDRMAVEAETLLRRGAELVE